VLVPQHEVVWGGGPKHVVVATFSVEVGRPTRSGSLIPHLVPTASWGDEAVGVNRVLTPVMAGDDGVVALLKASSVQSSFTRSCCSEGNPRFGSPGLNDGGASVSLSLLGASFLEQLLDGGGKRWSGVHLPRRRCRVLVAWRRGVSETSVP
jgi:hypothetical protein